VDAVALAVAGAYRAVSGPGSGQDVFCAAVEARQARLAPDFVDGRERHDAALRCVDADLGTAAVSAARVAAEAAAGAIGRAWHTWRTGPVGGVCTQCRWWLLPRNR